MTHHPLNLTVYIDCEDKFLVKQVENYFKDKGIGRSLYCHQSTGCIFIRDNIQVGDISRIAACRRKTKDVPIMVYTGFSTDTERVTLFNVGIDMHTDYPRPFEELYLRFMVMMRRYRFYEKRLVYHAGDFTLALLQLIRPDGIKIKLSQREYEIMQYLFVHCDELIRKGDIMEAIKGESDFFAVRVFDVYLTRIRKHLIDTPLRLEGVHGRGIVFRTK